MLLLAAGASYWTLVAVPIVVAVVGPVLTYKATVRNASGDIKTTAADKLWAEVNSMKDEYKLEAKERGVENAQLREDLEKFKTDNGSLSRQLSDIRERVVQVEANALEAKQATEECQAREANLLLKIQQLEERLG